MEELLNLFLSRRSVRNYTGEPIPEEQLRAVLAAGLSAASGKNSRPWRLLVVRDRATLDRMAGCRTGAAQMLLKAGAAVVVLGAPEVSDTYAEDCAIVLANMHLMADALGLGSCWIQNRMREASDGRTTEDYLRALLGFPQELRPEAILSLGIPASHPAARTVDELPWDHVEEYHGL